MKKNNKGFTLIEVMVVVLLIAILAAMGVPQYLKVAEKQKGTEAMSLVSSISNAQERYYVINEKYATDFSALDLELVDAVTRQAATGNAYNSNAFSFTIAGTTDAAGTVTATRRDGGTYIFKRIYSSGEICCKSNDPDVCDMFNITKICS